MNIKKYILENLLNNLGRFDKRIIKKIPHEIITLIEDLTIKCEGSFNERIYWVLNDLEDYDKSCPTCGNKIKNRYSGLAIGYDHEYCSPKCAITNRKTHDTRNKTNAIRYGEDANKIITARGKDKRDKTNTERYGGISPLCCKIVREKGSDTIEELYGVRNAFQSAEIKEIIVETNIERYGHRCPMHNQEVFRKSQKANNFMRKEMILPSGKMHLFQGYENIAILDLLKIYSEEEIELDNTPSVNYLYEKSKNYFPDIYIPKHNLIIEVKSTYTYSQNIAQNLLKAKACIDAGYNFEFYVCSSKKVLMIVDYFDMVLLSVSFANI